ncbi:hypothetical protein HPDFL43_09482 [Hoeflea phototrophica DFL-43]|jgi:hypothetical protein|uniref:Lipoprotein n=1 Tax=Hoeflea phototrophica (strain DSM 17068 / NCIMB 14078 / DFL-43) TaxID=411684 RepID=A9D6B2_HOEPD|nr:hypothetical protein [Hoeflea phototrophica]EDQ33457.2 hypothetical protein HPDFL43_09482 [Hoeflea phototrophica DFL-43]
MSFIQDKPFQGSAFAFASLAMLLSGCAAPVAPSGASAHAQAVATLQRVNSRAHACWLKDSDFKDYGLVPELDTTSTPRLLVIPRGKPQSLPQAVIIASADGAQFYGPLASSPLANRINDDISRWAAGAAGC